MSEGSGGIQVTTVLEQDVEQVAGGSDRWSTRSLFARVGEATGSLQESGD